MGKRSIKFIKAGFGNIVPFAEIVAVVSPSSAPIKRVIQKAKEEKGQKDADSGKEKGLFDYTDGRKVRSAIITDYGRVYLSALQPETILAKTRSGMFNKTEDLDE